MRTSNRQPADPQSQERFVLGLRAGELVEVRSADEILATLDERGELEALPFMPEMLRYCGQRLRVHKRATKLCDTVNWAGMYRMANAVHLERARCDGQAHGGCQAGCLTYWKEAWLKRVPADTDAPQPAPVVAPATLLRATRTADSNGDSGAERFSCQATRLPEAAPTRVPPWDLGQYVEDVRSGNTGVLAILRSLCVAAFNHYQDASRRWVPGPLRLRGGRRYPFIEGKLRATPAQTMDLRPGELVRVKPKAAIVATLDSANRNRGLSFDSEMLKYCGREFRVLRRVERLIDEKSGKLLHLKHPCVILEGVVCTSDYHRLCPREIYTYWREIWLERVE